MNQVRKIPFQPVKRPKHLKVVKVSNDISTHQAVEWAFKISKYFDKHFKVSTQLGFNIEHYRGRGQVCKVTSWLKRGETKPFRVRLTHSKKAMEWIMRDGYREYKSIERVVRGAMERPKGIKGVYMVAIHEYAHVLQQVRGSFAKDRKLGNRRDVHGYEFVSFMHELMDLLPFDEAMEKIKV